MLLVQFGPKPPKSVKINKINLRYWFVFAFHMEGVTCCHLLLCDCCLRHRRSRSWLEWEIQDVFFYCKLIICKKYFFQAIICPIDGLSWNFWVWQRSKSIPIPGAPVGILTLKTKSIQLNSSIGAILAKNSEWRNHVICGPYFHEK